MNTCTPDGWKLIKINCGDEILYKVFGSWIGGYLYGDAWRLNSGITHWEEDDKCYRFYGYSGSCYECRKESNRISAYNASVLAKYLEEDGVELIDIEDFKEEFISE